MVKNSKIPSTSLFTDIPGVGLRGPTKEEDELWGLANEPGVRVLLHIASSLAPMNSLVIGSGTGLIPIFLSALSRENALIDAVDISYKSRTHDGALISVPSIDLDYIPKNEKLTPGYYIQYFRDLNIRQDVEISEHGTDSTLFFQNKVKSLEVADHGQYDIIFVDGAHTYAQAKLDIIYSWGLLREGGVIIVDDFNKSYVSGLESVNAALHPVLDQGYMVFFVGEDDRNLKTEVAFAIKDSKSKRPGLNDEVKEALREAYKFAGNIK